ncbi:protein-methionine-sulfoxide reductase heme-binding subunit MsrQ [Pseudomonas sp. Marseille-QA0892]
MPHPRLRFLLFIGLVVPPCRWIYQASIFALGPDPGSVIILNLGQWALALVLSSLCMTPLQQLTGWKWVAFRRQLGLWSFAYALLHGLAYLTFILGFDWLRLGEEIQRRPYILVGLLAFVCLLALAATSNRRAMRALGRNWKRIHRLVYVAVALALLHMLWIVRSDVGEWAIYCAVFIGLIVLRVPVVAAMLKERREKFALATKSSN